MHRRYRVGLDVGGTFTDLFLFDRGSGRTYTHKVPSTPHQPHLAPLRGIAEILEKAGAIGKEVEFVGLGTTVATNALLENKGALTAVVTTKGFRDLLEIGRQTRPHLYDPFVNKTPQLVPRDLRREVAERVNAHGQVELSLDEAGLLQEIDYLRTRGVKSIAVCFLNTYLNPVNEHLAVRIIRRHWPEVNVIASYDIVPEFREYERFITTVVNAYLVPATYAYFTMFENMVAGLGIDVQPFVMSSSGGVFSPKMAAQRPIDTLFSGPSGGVSGAVFVSQLAGIQNVIALDMGGTSTEVCLIRDGKPQLSHQRVLNGYPIKTASFDIHTIGAGGSSIARMDDGGLLHVGPESVGADPGPACYEKGGIDPTVTDANVVLGRLNPDYLLDGRLKINAGKSAEVIQQKVASQKGIDVVAAAGAIIALAEASMAQALRVVSVERGIDPADFHLVAIGGAGPLHAAAVAKQVGMAGVLIPPNAGVLCALGVLTKDIQLSASRSTLVRESQPDACEKLDGTFQALERQIGADLAEHATHGRDIQFQRYADVRYRSQNHELSIPVANGNVTLDVLEEVKEAFHRAHEELYGYRFADREIELVTLRLTGFVPVDRPVLAGIEKDGGNVQPTVQRYRKTYFNEEEPQECPIYRRETFTAGTAFEGPAIVEQMDTTVIVPPGFRVKVDAYANLLMTWH